MKLCKECQHCYRDPRSDNPSNWKCHAKYAGSNPLTGSPNYFYFCGEMRKSTLCGKSGKLFQQKSGD
jgi:hypothetical protein